MLRDRASVIPSNLPKPHCAATMPTQHGRPIGALQQEPRYFLDEWRHTGRCWLRSFPTRCLVSSVEVKRMANDPLPWRRRVTRHKRQYGCRTAKMRDELAPTLNAMVRDNAAWQPRAA